MVGENLQKGDKIKVIKGIFKGKKGTITKTKMDVLFSTIRPRLFYWVSYNDSKGQWFDAKDRGTWFVKQ